MDIYFAFIKPCIVAALSVTIFFILKPLNIALAACSGLVALLAGTVFFCGISASEKEVFQTILTRLKARQSTVKKSD